ncbi:hypothetical protein [Sphingomonas sp.]|jgi:hypothetical protein|uniref:hypothetical protein n=1 Tax=Sphingomonas sp. TaxID=28214 RepID=UPI002ED7F7B0
MRTTIKMLAAAALALTSTIGMAQEGEHRFVHNGSTYVYTAAPTQNGRTVISGRRLPTGETFRLVVRDGRVSGTSGGVPVAFRTAAARGAAAGVEIASN